MLHSEKSLAETNPELADQWHPTKNGGLSPFDVSPRSSMAVWWKCPKGDDHEWKTRITHRNNGVGCPICSNRKIVKSNSLATLNPNLAKEWHPTKNDNLTPYDVGIGSSTKVWWKCSKGEDHEWKTTVVHRTNGKGCPICSGHKVAKSTSLATLKPDLAREWHPTKNGNLSPYDVSPGSSKKVWWVCPKGEGHEWEAMVNNRTKGSGCAVCVNQTVVDSNCLENVDPELAKQWHPTKNGNLKPKDITFGSTKKVWWQCPKGKNHEWKTSPSRRRLGTGCPFCTNPSSTPELRILSELRSIFPKVDHRVIIDGFEVDIYIPELKVGIEYDGKFWHINKQKQDLRKNNALRGKIKLIRVRDKGLTTLTEDDIQQKTTNITIETIKSILVKICKLSIIESTEISNKINNYHKIKSWVASKGFRKLHAAKDHIAFEDSIEYLYPEIAKQWHHDKNEPLLPKYFLPGSNKKVWWKCSEGNDHEWESQIADRCLNNTGCAICSNKKIVTSNCLATLNPELAKQWHPSKNGNITPYDVGVGSNKKAWWKCPKGDDHEWRTSVVHRSERNQNCPICSNKKIITSNCLATLNPELAKQWHPTKNENLTPYNVGVGSNKKAWWKCPEGDDHVWQSIIINRHKGSGCPVCSNQKIVKSNSLATTNPDLAKEWHPSKNGDLTPSNVSIGSGKKVWWKCSKSNEHEWQSVIKNRKRGDDCPICSNHQVIKSNSLETLFPELADQWHPTKNIPLLPGQVTPGSNKTVWWTNNNGHDWQEKIFERVKKTQKQNNPDQLSLFGK
ncbi:zinc-ribbon domain-containing protein [Aestuariibaculum sp. M13]|uniref:zinc-ribbon domain-containing protein n=1 Tax=Aestuariibaculum sp. M13 TaxID=2967132 RepID=UPI002159C93D|nr:zinc-ribbon domain-containing protein [Aestuariibaculum sp. M13]MCR8666237.1 zinc-ribbon domain-containing protein [Aestuariibaculum sp. M13]